MTRPLSICWFRQDLRLADNPALCAAAARGEVLPVFILDDGAAGEDRIGAANRWWLHHSLAALKASLGGVLHIMAGDALELIPRLVAETGASAVHWNRSYEAWRIERDSKLKTALTAAGTEAVSHNGALLWEPWEVQKGDGTPYKVFTPFYRRGCLAAAPPRAPLPAPQIGLATPPSATSVDDLDLLPAEDWGEMLAPHWQIGEAGAEARLQAFLDGGIAGYKEGRNIPAKPNVSRLSPHLHWGEISVNRVWHAARDRSDLTWTQTDQALGEQLGHMGSLVTPDSACIDIGAGKSQLAAEWVSLGAGHVAVLDVSDAALDYQRSVLPQTCEFIGASVLDWTATRRYTLWHDRAVFHFLTDPQDQSAYVAQMLHALEPGGVAVLSTFDADGPARCSNLPVQRYSSAQLADVVHRLSNGALVAQRGYQTQHITPKSNRQAFQTTLFHKIAR